MTARGWATTTVASAVGPTIMQSERVGGPVTSGMMGPWVTSRGLPTRERTVRSDGVFAIIITILVLEIAVPANLSERPLTEALDDLRPTFVARSRRPTWLSVGT